MITPADRRRLLRWFRSNHRPMPWRENRDPYRIWVSEVMLQQTTVATVTPRFAEFISRFPTLRSLAEADEQVVLKSWEGLGYYSRARNLHRAAKILTEQFGDDIPDDPAVWADLPGVGRYILGAVLSQAFDRRLPVVEANTRRVLARLGANRTELTTPEMQKWLWQTATDMLPRQHIGDFNQAMMELGATVCTVREPDCPNCPLRASCQSFLNGLQNEIPVIAGKTVTEQVLEACAVIRWKNRVFLRQRGDTGRWAKMWEFPTREYARPADPVAVASDLTGELKMPPGETGSVLMTLRYSVTRFRIQMTCVEITLSENPADAVYDDNGRWVSLEELSAYPVRSSQRTLAEALIRPLQRELF
ncbi:A/G-specific adenine glycosylase [Zavarzinella formosa]|uniref:A/G-specific adenine glycosylase n=1 Tax=Zavarzinella formosa TaxID=360055 RepID=UPI000494E26C|nr:A/G-specific adenine glycosylase [Zavarzinella formosa]